MTRLTEQLNFIKEIEKLKTIKRQNLTLDHGRQENSAEHSWHLAVMAMVLLEQCDSNDVDELRVIKMLLIHDLVEIYAGDAFLFDEIARKSAKEKELEGLEALASLLPDDQAEDLKNLWLEFEACETKESKYAKSIDALQPLIGHLQTAPKNHNPHNLSASQVFEKKAFIKDYTPKLWDTAEETINLCIKKGLFNEG